MKYPISLGDRENSFVNIHALKNLINLKIDELVDAAPETLNTLKELADAIEQNGLDDLATKEEIEQLQSNIVQSDWNQSDSTAIDYIKNKPEVALKSDLYTTAIDANGHDYVEIGGIKWATMNVGASSITDTGLYFQYGDMQGYTASQVGNGSGQKNFGWADYEYGNGTSSPGAAGMTKYNSTDRKTVLDVSDDAVAAAWGGNWRMPTTAEFQALSAAVNTAWTDDYQGSGVAGLVCTDKTDSSKTLFFPACGFCDNAGVYNAGSFGLYWSSSLYGSYVTKAYYVGFHNGKVGWQYEGNRCKGDTVRGVLAEEVVPKFASTSDLSALEARIAVLEAAQQ